jgi:hypothetical protein
MTVFNSEPFEEWLTQNQKIEYKMKDKNTYDTYKQYFLSTGTLPPYDKNALKFITDYYDKYTKDTSFKFQCIL